MNLIDLKVKNIKKSSLNGISSEFAIKLKEVENHLLQKYEDSIKWMNLMEGQTNKFKDDFLKYLSFYKIIYPKGKPVLISNARDGDFEYGYSLTVIENIGINVIIDTKVSFGDTFSTYLFKKENDDEPSFLFLYEAIGDSGERTDNVIVVEY